MKVECHIIQNYPPHCLNRDDTNTPKDCEFGGVRRARISSQCLKRAAREAFERHQLIPEGARAVRTKRVLEQVVTRLCESGQRERPDAVVVVKQLLAAGGLKTEDPKDGEEPKTQYLLFLPSFKLGQLAELAEMNWDALRASEAPPADDEDKASKKKSKKQGPELDKAIKASVRQLLRDATQSPEVALFGRMIADNPDWNVDAACQVAHAISTHRVSMDFDFFTAVDDLNPETETGSGMMGTIQFNSSCFYRYACIDTETLAENLGGDRELAVHSVDAFLKAFTFARPSGKQNSMAAHSLPALVLVTTRAGGEPISLANAFADPVSPAGKGPKNDDGLVGQSIRKLRDHLAQMAKMYPQKNVTTLACSLDKVEWDPALVASVDNVADLFEKVQALLDEKSAA